MATEIKLPELGDGISSGTAVSIFVKVGDVIEEEQALVELETDKAVIEVPASVAGVVTKILIKEGDELAVGQGIIEVDAPAKAEARPAPLQATAPVQSAPAETSAPLKKSVSAPASGPVDVLVPNMGDGVDSGTVSSVLVKPGDKIQKEDPLIELETDKAVIEVPSDSSGTVKEIFVKEGDTLTVGQKIISLVGVVVDTPVQETEKEATPVSAAPIAQVPDKPAPALVPMAPVPQKSSSKLAAASPTVRRFAREIGLDIHDVPGSGPGGRISINDVKAFSKLRHQQNATGQVAGSVTQQTLPDFSKWGKVEIEKMNKLRQTSATHLSYAWSTIPHVTQFDKADITELEKLRKANGKKAEAAGGKLTMTAILIKVMEAALRKFPEFNASIDMQKKEIIYKNYFNIGVAVDTERGLLVPVIKNVDTKNVIDISVELTKISQKARDRKLTIDDMQGGNISISNLGGIGGYAFTPIVNAPEVAILGVSRAEMEPKFKNGSFEPRLMMPLSLSYDHRIIDGASAARFLRWICTVLESPFTVMLEG